MMKINEVTSASMEQRAMNIAKVAHRDQKYGTQPYVNHLADVVRRVKTITNDPEVIAAAWLHDTVEDTQVTIGDIKREFGDNVAAMVWAVTGVGQDRAEKMANAIEKIAQTPGSELVKSADRLSNAAASKDEKKMKLYNRYKDEHTNLSPVLGNNALAQELVRLFAD
jgi:guanosine-3',5'-bis(diphosphate) 3'-pyrophosphohydrolase